MFKFHIIKSSYKDCEASRKDKFDDLRIDLMLTARDAGVAPKGLSQDATTKICDRAASYISGDLRAYKLCITTRAMLPRAASGIRGNILITNLSGRGYEYAR